MRALCIIIMYNYAHNYIYMCNDCSHVTRHTLICQDNLYCPRHAPSSDVKSLVVMARLRAVDLETQLKGEGLGGRAVVSLVNQHHGPKGSVCG